MQRKFRLTRSTDIKRVRHSGKAYASPLVTLYVEEDGQGRLRIGVTASRMVGGAVQRNRAKRLLREAARREIPSLRAGWNLLLVARPPLVDSGMEPLREALMKLLARAGLVNEPNG